MRLPRDEICEVYFRSLFTPKEKTLFPVPAVGNWQSSQSIMTKRIGAQVSNNVLKNDLVETYIRLYHASNKALYSLQFSDAH